MGAVDQGFWPHRGVRISNFWIVKSFMAEILLNDRKIRNMIGWRHRHRGTKRTENSRAAGIRE
ncbi:hypothetical protein NQ317_016298 [Molorchus minor]|uniref:Uncharacterized protein n=1 Tax=Molorchus minor TaxID=1323400 RepID=A0ABQ9ITV9_9CUCU|nr:hypothetical protein NQ317_016298 [Molorchus minor]